MERDADEIDRAGTVGAEKPGREPLGDLLHVFQVARIEHLGTADDAGQCRHRSEQHSVALSKL